MRPYCFESLCWNLLSLSQTKTRLVNEILKWLIYLGKTLTVWRRRSSLLSLAFNEFLETVIVEENMERLMQDATMGVNIIFWNWTLQLLLGSASFRNYVAFYVISVNLKFRTTSVKSFFVASYNITWENWFLRSWV